MARLAAAPALFLIVMTISLAACSRGQPDYGLTADKLRQDATAASNGGEPARPGTPREFETRVGDTVYFTTDSTSLGREAQSTLIAQARWLNRYPQFAILIQGHADERGTREYNLALGARRAESTKRFLISRGVEPRRIRTVTYGKERPVATCANISCWSKNRRTVTVLDRRKIARR